MKKTFFFLFYALFLVQPVLAEDFRADVTAELKKDPVWVDVEFPEGSTASITEFRVWYEYPANQIFPVLIDTNGLPKLHKAYKDARTLTQELFDKIVKANPTEETEALKILGDSRTPSDFHRKKGEKWTDYVYQNFNFPWPLSDRWTILKVEIDETQAALGKYRFQYTLMAGNFKRLEGWWELIPIADKPGWTEWRGRYESDVGVALPKFVTKKGAKTGFKREVQENSDYFRKIFVKSQP